MTAVNQIGWFQIGTDQPEAAERFYGELFGWAFADDETAGAAYRIITTPGEGGLQGGLANTEGRGPNHAVFSVVVADTEATCRQAEAAGGKVLVKRTTADGLTLAHLLDPSGNQFQIFTPPAG
ncbi:glyoxalase [Actinoplanes lobatus]|uniref:Glyoxalase n=1 Tax=Actinoplanes lobatus TaxID=113568 RepID=A0A7W7HEY2_9ACTN|nr:VOC family protein [Actinoplanes lobatus]MBB4749290.1 putative enzyme related to lactoylglutathione lyase [Actinoplanes lobatus]GGN79900.1 glyoxalase [Actinoplanes lobatus]GIE40229.1 glyoxalase [Actinoplanes lobatus]